MLRYQKILRAMGQPSTKVLAQMRQHLIDLVLHGALPAQKES